jgi:putative transcriptional regulator
MANNGTTTGSKRICHLRNSKGISQSELARRCGMSRQALGAIETGVYQPSVTVAIKLAHELGETVESLFGESDVVVSVKWWKKNLGDISASYAVKGNPLFASYAAFN